MSKKEVKLLRRAQFSITFIVLLAVITGGVLVILGYNIIKSNVGRQCTTNLDIFQENIKAMIDGIAHKSGSIEEYEYKRLCGINKVYFVDKDKEINVTRFNETPEIMHNVNSSSNDNVFLMAENELKRAFYAGSIEIPNPNYLCFAVNDGILKMLLEGKGGSTRLKHKDNLFNCGSTIIEPTIEEAEEILNETFTATEFVTELQNITGGETEALQMFSETEESVEMSREEISCEGENALVEIKIAPKGGKGLKGFRYMEWIPKSCIEDISNKVTSEGFTLGTDFFVKGDPLIMWKFDGVEEEEDLSYTITGKCEEMVDCEAILEGMGFAETVEEVSNLEHARKFSVSASSHSHGGHPRLQRVRKLDEFYVIIDDYSVLHIETDDELEKGDRIIINANCETAADISLRGERRKSSLGAIVDSEHCSAAETKSFVFTLPEVKSNEYWDITSIGTVKLDFITTEESD